VWNENNKHAEVNASDRLVKMPVKYTEPGSQFKVFCQAQTKQRWKQQRTVTAGVYFDVIVNSFKVSDPTEHFHLQYWRLTAQGTFTNSTLMIINTMEYTVWVKKVAPVKLCAIFSLVVNLQSCITENYCCYCPNIFLCLH